MIEGAFYGMPHVVEAQQFSRQWIEESFFKEVKIMEDVVKSRGCHYLDKKIMMGLFYEPSTRTRFSFESAMLYLGGRFLQTENAAEFSSAIKGETLEDSIRVLCQYRPDVIVIRHPEDDAAIRAVQISGNVVIMNAGNGKLQHPTQGLLDILTIQKELGGIDGKTIAMVGDLANGRTVRSLSYLLGKFKGIKIYFVSPVCAQMGQDIKAYLTRHGVSFCETENLKDIVGLVDIIYQTRIQKERGSQLDDFADKFVIDKTILGMMKKDAIVMHPLPRVNEITPDVDQDPRAAYFRQAGNGLYTRMALLRMALAPNM